MSSGKGDTPRLRRISRDKFESNWDAAFGKKPLLQLGRSISGYSIGHGYYHNVTGNYWVFLGRRGRLYYFYRKFAQDVMRVALPRARRLFYAYEAGHTFDRAHYTAGIELVGNELKV